MGPILNWRKVTALRVTAPGGQLSIDDRQCRLEHSFKRRTLFNTILRAELYFERHEGTILRAELYFKRLDRGHQSDWLFKLTDQTCGLSEVRVRLA
jgi:hypothetical protein